MSIARPLMEDSSLEPKMNRMEIRPALSFSDEDKVETLQPHDDALVVTLRIGGVWCEEGVIKLGQRGKDHVPWFV